MSPPRTDRFQSYPVPLRPAEDARTVVSALPSPLTSFVGRESDIAAINERLRDSVVRLVTLTGPGGVGKTRLSIQVAESLRDIFPVCSFVSLAAIEDSALVVSTIAQALGVRETGDRPLIDRIARQLAAGPVLLILDNFEKVVDAAGLVTDLLERCPRLKVLVTSRLVLRATGEHDYSVPPLDLPSRKEHLALDDLAQSESVSLFVQRARAAHPGFVLTEDNAGAVGEICKQLDGLPLAIELAAAQSRVLSPNALLVRLSHRLDVLSRGPRDQPARLQTMRAALAWSYDLLTLAQQAFFRQLCVFAGGFTLDAIASVAQDEHELKDEDLSDSVSGPASPRLSTEFASESTVLDKVIFLVDASLATHTPDPTGEPRFRILETIREYGLERLAESGDDSDVRSRHAAYYLGLAGESEPHLIGD